jgi:HTH-type transcriptional regulator, sugar sensing transcriptional regulator
MVEIKQVLKNFGLTENEAEVYLVLLKLGWATASEIAEKTQIHRINIYDILERLQERGLASFAISGKRKQYEAVNPKKILEIEEQRKEDIKNIIPELLKQRESGKDEQEAVIYKDKKGIRNILEEITKSKAEVLLFASGWGFSKYFSEYFDIWYGHLKANKVKMKTLMSNKAKNNNIPEVGEYKFLPSEFTFPSTTCVFEDKVLIIMWSEQSLAILITGEAASISYKEYFNLLWKLAQK